MNKGSSFTPSVIVLALAGACGSQSSPADMKQATQSDMQAAQGDMMLGGQMDGPAIDPQLPPTMQPDLMNWLSAGYYKSWHCEAAKHPPGPHGAHGANRVCSNDAVSSTPDNGKFPVGAASVKELYGGGDTVAGYAVSVHAKAGDTGDDWYWSEYGSGGFGDGVCVGCHSLAGSGGTYTGHDYVFVIVK